jgi:hypothetical protein
MPDLDPQLIAVLAVTACAAAALLGVVVLLLALRLRRLHRRQQRAFGTGLDDDVLGVLARQHEAIERLRADLRAADDRTVELREILGSTVSRLGMIRYDAFEDMGGALSFSAALLDERGTGIVLSAINGRTETRCYAKPIHSGVSGSDHDLSVEEEAAIGTAVAGIGMRQAPPATARRGRRRA